MCHIKKENAITERLRYKYILIGENIIPNANSILRDPDQATKSENSCSRDEITAIVTEMINKNER